MTTEEIKAFFDGDTYATKVTGITIEDVKPGYSKCRLIITSNHRNAAGLVMGGVPYTLADFAFAVATNSGNEVMTVTTTGQITYLNPCRGNELVAECVMLKDGRRNCFYRVDIRDEKGEMIATVNMSGAHLDKKPSPLLTLLG